MAKDNWALGETVRPADMNQIGSEINQLRDDVDNIEVPPASLTRAGITQLSDVLDSDLKDRATTPSTVKTLNDNQNAHVNATSVHGAVSAATANRLIIRDSAGRAQVAAPSAAADIARLDTVTGQVGALSGLQTTAKTNTVAAINEVFQSGVSAKQGVVDAINAMGGSASTSDTWATLALKIKTIQTGPKYATGTLASSASASSVIDYSGGSLTRYLLTFTGLSFRPNRVIIRRGNTQYEQYVYSFATRNAAPSNASDTANYNLMAESQAATTAESIRVYELTGSLTKNSCYINDSAFSLSVYSPNTTYIWEAFRV